MSDHGVWRQHIALESFIIKFKYFLIHYSFMESSTDSPMVSPDSEKEQLPVNPEKNDQDLADTNGTQSSSEKHGEAIYIIMNEIDKMKRKHNFWYALTLAMTIVVIFQLYGYRLALGF